MPTLTPPGANWPPRNDSGIGHNVGKLGGEAAFSFREVDGYRETFEESDTTATRVFDVSWLGRLAWKDFVLGYSVVTGNAQPAGGGGLINNAPQLSRSVPWAHPEMPWLYARRVELLNGLGAYIDRNDEFAVDGGGAAVLRAGVPIPLRMIRYVDDSTGADGWGRYAVTYGVRDYQVIDDATLAAQFQGNELARWVERKFTYAAQNLPLPAASVVFANGPFVNTAIGQQGNILITGTKTIKWTWRQVPDVPHDALDSALGHVNATAFDGLGGFPLYPPGTLLMMAPATERFRGPTGRIHWRIEVNGIYRKQTWNSYPAADGNFYPVVNKNTGLPVYPSFEFGNVFLPPTPVVYQ